MFDIAREADAAKVIIQATLIESNMDDIEAVIARDFMLSALKYMEDPQYA